MPIGTNDSCRELEIHSVRTEGITPSGPPLIESTRPSFEKPVPHELFRAADFVRTEWIPDHGSPRIKSIHASCQNSCRTSFSRASDWKSVQSGLNGSLITVPRGSNPFMPRAKTRAGTSFSRAGTNDWCQSARMIRAADWEFIQSGLNGFLFRPPEK